jgi:hypothetical protein
MLSPKDPIECKSREYLAEVFKVATRELTMVLNEEYKLVLERSPRMAEFEAIVKLAINHWRDAKTKYLRHLDEHQCARPKVSAMDQ